MFSNKELEELRSMMEHYKRSQPQSMISASFISAYEKVLERLGYRK